MLVGSTIGSGIFRVPAGVAQRLHDPGPVVVAWVLGGAVALFGALTLAELAAALPRSGGVFAYLLEGFGPLPAFLFGWSELTVIRASALGAIATIFAEYLGYFVKLGPEQVRWTAAAAVLVIGLVNYLGVRSASRFMNLITALKYGSLAGLALLAFTSPRHVGALHARLERRTRPVAPGHGTHRDHVDLRRLGRPLVHGRGSP